MMPKPNPKTTRRTTGMATVYQNGIPRVFVQDNGHGCVLWVTNGKSDAGFVLSYVEAARVARVLSPEPRRRKAGGR